MARSRRGVDAGAEARFWGMLLAVLSVGIYGWYAGEFEARFGLSVLPGDGSIPPREVLERVEAYGLAGRRAFLAFLSLACLVPVAGSLVLLRLYEVLDVSPRRRSGRTWVAVLPAVAALLENTLHALLVVTYPTAGMVWATLAYAACALKVLACAGAALMLALLASSWLRRRVDADPHADPHETI